MAAPNSISTRLQSLLPVAFVVTAVVAIAWRLTTIVEPLGIDQSLWASAVRGMSRGQLLYRDVWEQRPPGIYFTYLWSFTLLGWRESTVAWMDIAATAVTTTLIFVIARRLASQTTAALAAAMYAVLTMPAWLYRNGGILERSVCETFIVVCVCVAVLCADTLRRRGSLRAAFFFGVWTSMAALYKPNAAIYFPALLAWAIVAAEPPVGRSARFWSRATAVAIAGALILPALTFIWLWRLDLIGEAKIAVLDFNRWYVSRGFTFSGYAEALAKAIYLRIKQDPLWFCGAIGVLGIPWVLIRSRRFPPLALLAVFWGAGAAAVIAVNGIWLFNTYFMNPLPPLALLGAWWLTGSKDRPKEVWFAIATVAVMAFLFYDRNYWPKVTEVAALDVQYMRGQIDRGAYLDRFGGYGNDRGYSARANDELGAYVRAHSSFEDRIYLFGINGAGVYYLSDRLTANRFLRANFFVPDAFPDPRFTLHAVIEELRAAKPLYVIFETLHSESEMGVAVDALPQNPLLQPLLEDYRSETTIEDFKLYRRR